MWIKYIVLVLIVAILYSLGKGLFHLVGKKKGPNQLATALTWRIGLSLLAFIILMVAYCYGWINPHAI